MGKSRLADVFGEECPMINFILHDESSLGYPPPDGEVRSFMCRELSKQNKYSVINSLWQKQQKGS
jgi:hypothetical protein